ncbi:hypothetical protein I4I73_29930 [Pseudonocardia sp. KRD-184]|uniref:Uncharacterized protein n=1 Tax=Pseudonocardia oceani TaxID=2792013 RepID=A0ABS6UHJ6_9PSEU|nr:hypothetical protein [Pseudonocardia oceani]MBW0100205.1 hypothetical protein [Pseudonocardia oceani]MBW0112924.1 hypothetical protein [Pseudonocardia oceani]MBW0123514.1 hypothetical protein [Pseudonocardia oceani]MBW0131294.1 hypothetical protein [Pseudonocardia oceani]
MGDYDDPELTGEERRRPDWLVVGAVVLALVAGLAVGFLLGGGTSRESSVASVETSTEPAPPPAPAAPPADAPAPQPCLEAGSAASRILQELDAAVVAISALDPGALREILDRLQPAQAELERAVAACGSVVGPAR